MNVEDFIQLLDRVRKNGKNWSAKCPAHEDKKCNSLSIAEGKDGRILVNCFAGCKALDIVEALGLELHQLMPERSASPDMDAWRTHRGLIECVRGEAIYLLLTARDMAKGMTPAKASAHQKRLREAVVRLDQADKLIRGKLTDVPWLRHGTPIRGRYPGDPPPR